MRRRVSIATRAIRLALSLLSLALSVSAYPVPYRIASDSNGLWTVSDANGNLLGNAQAVCLNAGASCPPGATPLGYPLPGWTADLSAIPGAKWIWAPGVTGTTSPAAHTEFTVQTQFYLCGAPTAARIWAAADNSAEVLLNGQSVLTSTSHSALAMVDLAATNQLSLLGRGLNIIEVRVGNAANPADCTSDQYHCNPAGVVVGGLFEDGLSALPTCTSGGRTFSVGEVDTLACPAGKVGSRIRPCICIGSNGFWGPVYDACTAPPQPPTCYSNGVAFPVDATETIACPVGQVGSRTRSCGAEGTWGPLTDTCQVPAQRPCISNGVTFAAGATETISCPSPLTGSRTRQCNDGAWGPINDTCRLPNVVEGAICGSREQGPTGICPAGTTCGPRQLPRQATPWWCAFFAASPIVPNECRRGANLQTADWYCDR